MRGFAVNVCKGFAVCVIVAAALLCFASDAYAGKPVYYDGYSDQFKVTVTWDVENGHDDVGNYIGVYYYMPGNGGYYTSNYKYVDYWSRAASEEGTRTHTFYLQGPPCRINMSVYGSAMDHTKYYINKVEVEPIHQRPGTGLPTKFTLWDGMFGCSVATMFTNTIACDLFLDRGKPEFSKWYDPYSLKEAVFGDDKMNVTDSYYDKGCQEPDIFGKDSDGVYYDQYGVAWPSYPPKMSSPKVSSKSGRKVEINWKNVRKKYKELLKKTKYVEVQYSTNSKLKGAKTIKVKKSKLNKKTVIKKLKAKRKYYFRVRLSNGDMPLTNWTRIIKIKVKK